MDDHRDLFMHVTQWVLASEFASKLTQARSIPDAMSTCQEWAGRRFKMMAEDSKHVLTDIQNFMENGLASSRSAGSSGSVSRARNDNECG